MHPRAQLASPGACGGPGGATGSAYPIVGSVAEALVAPRLKEVQAWRDRRRFRPWLRLAAFVRSAALG